jgi:Transcriptional Coactivator p15 (PC4)
VYSFKEPIGNDRYLTAGMFNDALMIHIRQYDEANGKIFPTKKGASFTTVRWATFIRHIEDVDRSVDLLNANQPVDYLQHIGGRYYVAVNKDFKCVNIRRYFLPPNATKEVPTRCGISLRLTEWQALLVKVRELQELLPELKTVKPCYSSLDHSNQAGYINCAECNPFAR